MVEVISQVAGLTKEVAVTYIAFFGIVELGKVVLTGVIGIYACKIIKGLISNCLDVQI